jgi:hypothetical protein
MIKKDHHQYKPLHTTKFHRDQMQWRGRGKKISHKLPKGGIMPGGGQISTHLPAREVGGTPGIANFSHICSGFRGGKLGRGLRQSTDQRGLPAGWGIKLSFYGFWCGLPAIWLGRAVHRAGGWWE